MELIRLTSSGRNALDFALAYYLGRKVLADPTGCFYIISKDKGYEPLVKHLQSRHIQAHLHASFSALPSSRAPKAAAVASKAEAAAPEDTVKRVLEHWKKNEKNRPKKKAKLLSHLKSQLGKDATDAAAAALLEKLIKAGNVIIGEKDTVKYI